jgi:Lambda phage tail tape-measure protein (Tape_meas_lam_C)
MPLATLSIDIEAKLAKLEQGMSQATRLVQKNASQMERAFSGIRTAGSAVGGALLAAIPVAFVSALVATTRSTLNAVDGFNDLREATGAGVGNISALDDIARRSGVTFDVAADALVKFNQQLKDSKPNDDTSRIFKALNLDIAELRKLDPAEALQRAAIALDRYATDGNKARAVQDLFGKSVREAAPLLRELAEAGTLNAKVTVEQARHVKEINDQLDALEANVVNAARGIILRFVPALNSLLSTLTNDGLLAALDRFGNSAFDWEGSQTRKQIKVLEADLDDLQKRAAVVDSGFLDRMKTLGGAGAIGSIGDNSADIAQQIATKQEQLKKLRAVNLGLNEGLAGGGRGLVNPAAAVPLPPSLVVQGKADTAAIDRAKKAYDELIRTVTERITQQQSELDNGKKLTEAQTFALDVIGKLAAADAKYSDVQKRAVTADLERLIGLEKATDAQKEAAEVRQKIAQIEQRGLDTLSDETERRIVANEQLQRYVEQIGLSDRQLQDLELSRIRDAIATERQGLAMAQNAEASAAEVEARERNIRLLERELQLRQGGIAKERKIEDDPATGAQRAIDKYIEKTGKLGTETERVFGGAIDAVEDKLSNLVKTGNSAIDALIAEFYRLNVVRPLLSQLFGLLGGIGGGGGGATSLAQFAGTFDGYREKGGPMSAQRWYVAGENGPEIVTGPGTVYSARDSAAMFGGGGPTIVQNITFNGGVTRNEVISGMVAAKNAALGEWADGARRGRWGGALA